MMCDTLRPALRDHAAGASAPSPLVDHLRSCAGCAAALADERRLLDEIDGVVGGLGDEEPSPAFLVRTRALAGPLPSSRRPTAALRWAAAILALGVGLPILGRLVPETTAPPAAAPAGPLAASASPSASPGTAAVASPRPAPRPTRRPALRPREVAPIVAPDQETAILRFAALIESGAVEAPRRMESDAPLPEPEQLYLPPLTIAPIEADEAPSEESR
jgi:hypothetical protein